MRRSAKTDSASAGRVRIIGGEWRGRWVDFRAAEGLRPTPDRVRETLFNWLQPHIEGAHCVDLFCGSGVLGLEALSRGAASCRFVDHSSAVLADLQGNISRLKATGATTVLADVLAWLREPGEGVKPFEIVFLDPPYRLALAEPCLGGLATSARVAGSARVYVETASDEPPLANPPGWTLHRDKRAGQVAYRLFIAASR